MSKYVDYYTDSEFCEAGSQYPCYYDISNPVIVIVYSQRQDHASSHCLDGSGTYVLFSRKIDRL